MRLVFRVNSHCKLIFTDACVAQMTSYRQRHFWSTEAGGILLGRHLDETGDIVVDEVTTPQRGDRRGRMSFFRSRKHHDIALQRWAQEQNTVAYLGLWHTHPEDAPVPSDVDRNDWQRAVREDKFYGDRLFFPIVGIAQVRVWTLSRSGVFVQLEPQEPKRGNES